mmetsp:Transcript_18514/g.26150  ORF Transcript_18514/g.26150 Transcript_18514/m.26150 type:complete len:244 (-) Transcript_18514:183-914(-)
MQKKKSKKMSIPSELIEQCIASNDDEPKVLLTTGCMAPVHKGHIAMLRAASEACPENIGCILSPSHDRWAMEKDLVDEMYAREHRVRMAELAVSTEEGIFISDWESKHFVDYPAVVQKTKKALTQACGKPVKVVYVCGADHVAKSGVRHARLCDGVIAVSREGAHPTHSSGGDGDDIDGIKWVVSKDFQNISSTQIREAVQLGKWDYVTKNVAPAVVDYLKLNCSRASYHDLKNNNTQMRSTG